ncbi:MAG: carboxylating nicotinate-nucleotide diphosphorylase, partial [Niameybacter sp.]
TTNAIIRKSTPCSVELICKQEGILAGIDVFKRTFELLGDITFTTQYQDGDSLQKGDLIGILEGDARVVLSGERTALNYLQRMSGIATLTRDMVQELEGSKTKLLDTRKTTPGIRVFEKYAVKVGGGYNHRFNLSDGILIKDNHINAAGGVKEAINMALEYAPFVRKIEVEVEDLQMLEEALEAKADIIMLDNMSIDMMKEAVERVAGRAKTECSGNVSKERLRAIAEVGVDYVSCGALTHSAPILDFSLKNLKNL